MPVSTRPRSRPDVVSSYDTATGSLVARGKPVRRTWHLSDVGQAVGGHATCMPIPKTYRFPVDVHWLHDKLTVASVPGKAPLEVATPPEFQGGLEGVWSPEDLFVGAVATCYTVTLVSAARRRQVPVRALQVRGFGDVGRRPDGEFGFVAVELTLELATDPGYENEARAAALDAEASCLVAVSLDTPVRVHVSVSAAEKAA
jgi:organic hydroperoxide reductase OsmC/OhrA